MRYRLIQPNLPILNQPHHARRCRHHLGERRQIKNRVQRHGFRTRRGGAQPKSFLVHDFSAMSHHQHCAGDGLVVDLLLHQQIDRRKVGRFLGLRRRLLFLRRGRTGSQKTLNSQNEDGNEAYGFARECHL